MYHIKFNNKYFLNIMWLNVRYIYYLYVVKIMSVAKTTIPKHWLI